MRFQYLKVNFMFQNGTIKPKTINKIFKYLKNKTFLHEANYKTYKNLFERVKNQSSS